MSAILNVWDEASQSYKPLPALIGRGIKSFTYDSSQDKWLVLYTDNTTELVKGPTLEVGTDGVSPTVELVAVDGGYQLRITDAEGTKTADILNGSTPQKGEDYFTDADKQEIAQAAAGLVETLSGSWNDLTDKPSTFPPSAHDHDATYLKLSGGVLAGSLAVQGGAHISGRYLGGGDDEGLVIGRANNSYAGLTLGIPDGVRSVMYLMPDNSAVWRHCADGTNRYDIKHPDKAGTVALTSDIPDALSDLAADATHRTVTDAEKSAWNAKSNFSGSYNDLTNKPTLFSGNYNDLTNKPTIPSAYSHPSTHAASMISAGTFAGAVVANASGQTHSTSLLRNSKLVNADTNPTVNGEINWTYK